MIVDTFGRSFKKLRVSLTHDCNYACVYCADGEKPNGTIMVEPKKVLPSSELIEIIRKLIQELKLNAIRLTGGEPMLHPRIRSIVSAIREMGISNIGMTTNGHLLYKRAKELAEAGLTSVNISLDAISAERFEQMSLRNGVTNVLDSIDAALNVGMSVKLNTVVVASKNDMEIIPLLKYALKKDILIRFLELMPMGPLHYNRKEMFFSKAQILELISSEFSINAVEREHNATSDYWNIGEKKAFGIIANDSSPFCSDCNRLRLDSYGNIYGCLSSLIPVPVSADISSEKLTEALQVAITHKQPSRFIGNKRTMQSIGG